MPARFRKSYSVRNCHRQTAATRSARVVRESRERPRTVAHLPFGQTRLDDASLESTYCMGARRQIASCRRARTSPRQRTRSIPIVVGEKKFWEGCAEDRGVTFLTVATYYAT